eukprot:353313-Chlamydomonas_euryale.AAC.9
MPSFVCLRSQHEQGTRICSKGRHRAPELQLAESRSAVQAITNLLGAQHESTAWSMCVCKLDFRSMRDVVKKKPLSFHQHAACVWIDIEDCSHLGKNTTGRSRGFTGERRIPAAGDQHYTRRPADENEQFSCNLSVVPTFAIVTSRMITVASLSRGIVAACARGETYAWWCAPHVLNGLTAGRGRTVPQLGEKALVPSSISPIRSSSCTAWSFTPCSWCEV